MSTEESEAPRSTSRRLVGDLSFLQVIGSALAAITSAVAASRLGVAGTVVGAALGSVIATVGGTLYSNSLRLNAEKLAALRGRGRGGTPQAADPEATRVLPRTAARTEAAARTEDPPTEPVAAVGADAEAAPYPTEPTGPTGPTEPTEPTESPGRRRRIRWGIVVGAAGLIAVAAMAVITGVEAVLGHPLSDPRGSGTTVTALQRGDRPNGGGTEPADGPTERPGSGSEREPTGRTPEPRASAEPSVRPTPDADGSTPSADPGSRPTSEPGGSGGSGGSGSNSDADSGSNSGSGNGSGSGDGGTDSGSNAGTGSGARSGAEPEPGSTGS